jgi:hypothetical protein
LSGEDGLREEIGGLLDERELSADAIEEARGGVEVEFGRGHGGNDE